MNLVVIVAAVYMENHLVKQLIETTENRITIIGSFKTALEWEKELD